MREKLLCTLEGAGPGGEGVGYRDGKGERNKFHKGKDSRSLRNGEIEDTKSWMSGLMGQ